ncbi:TRAP transporter substrate-binding protein [Neobacillus vireti]|uniref:TRAP transporter substrate-binding protein n=1 Tax=Neobacillus vireti TaxID=220686 RepID=UPI003000CECB
MENVRKMIHNFVLIICFITLTACGSNASSGDSSKTSGGKEEKYNLTFNVPLPDTTKNSKPMYYATHWIKEELEKRSEGRLKIDLYFNGQLAQQPEMLDALASGTIDMGNLTPTFYGDTVPEGYISYFPYWNKTAQEAYDLMYKTEIGEILNNAMMDNGVKPLMYTFLTDNGWLLTKPVHSMEDMKGMLIASMGGLWNTWYEELGVVGVNISVPEWYDGLQRGIIDGVPVGYQTLKTLKLNEVVKYAVDPPVVNANMASTVISQKAMEKLPKDLQDLIIEVSKEAELNALEAGKEHTAMVKQILEENEKSGAFEVIHLSKKEEQKFYESVQPMWDKFASLSEGNKRMIEIIRKHREKEMKE